MGVAPSPLIHVQGKRYEAIRDELISRLPEFARTDAVKKMELEDIAKLVQFYEGTAPHQIRPRPQLEPIQTEDVNTAPYWDGRETRTSGQITETEAEWNAGLDARARRRSLERMERNGEFQPWQPQIDNTPGNFEAQEQAQNTQNALSAGENVDLLALPQGTGAIPMDTREATGEVIVPPTEYVGDTITTPYESRPALPPGEYPHNPYSGGQTMVQPWTGGTSQLAYPYGGYAGIGGLLRPQGQQTQAAPFLDEKEIDEIKQFVQEHGNDIPYEEEFLDEGYSEGQTAYNLNQMTSDTTPASPNGLQVDVLTPEQATQLPQKESLVGMLDNPFGNNAGPSNAYLVNSNERGDLGIRIDRSADGTGAYLHAVSESEGTILGTWQANPTLNDEQIIASFMDANGLTRPGMLQRQEQQATPSVQQAEEQAQAEGQEQAQEQQQSIQQPTQSTQPTAQQETKLPTATQQQQEKPTNELPPVPQELAEGIRSGLTGVIQNDVNTGNTAPQSGTTNEELAQAWAEALGAEDLQEVPNQEPQQITPAPQSAVAEDGNALPPNAPVVQGKQQDMAQARQKAGQTEALETFPAQETAMPQEKDPFGTAHAQFSGKPADAVEHLMRVKEGHVPAAFHKEGLGDIDLPWGKSGKKGFGLAHIIERRNSAKHDGDAFARSLPQIIEEGHVERREGFPGRAYIVHEGAEAVVGLQWMNNERKWILTAYPYLDAKKKSSEQRVDFRPHDRSHGDEQRLPSPHSEDVEAIIPSLEAERNPASTSEKRQAILAQFPEEERKKMKRWGLPRLEKALQKAKSASVASPDMVSSDQTQEALNNVRQDQSGEGTEPRLQQGDVRPDIQRADGNAARAAGERVGGSNTKSAPEGRSPERKIQGSRGRSTTVKIPNRNAEPVTYALMEAEDVQASHLPANSFQKNPQYKLENQRRYHAEPASQTKVLRNAQDLDASFLLQSVDGNHGAPIVDHEGNALGGNGRAMSISQAYEKFPAKAEGYRQALRENAEAFGLDPAEIDRMRRPVLVRRLDNVYDLRTRQELVSALNETFTDSKEARAASKSRGDRLSRRTLEALASGLAEANSLREYFDEPQSAKVVEQLIRDGVLQETERNAYVAADGTLNPDGKRVIEEALRGRVASSFEALAALPGPIVAKIDAAIPHLLVSEGIGKDWNITGYMREAIDLLAEFKASSAKDPAIFLNQIDILKGKAPKERFSQAAQQLFRLALDAKKKEYVNAFAKFAGQAKISPEAGGIPGIGKSAQQAAKEYLGIDIGGKAQQGQQQGKQQAKGENSQGRKTDTGQSTTAESAKAEEEDEKPLASLRSDGDTPSMAAVRKQYEGTEQWMKAPNGKPTNLNERQWLQVRTPE
ncbi:MAG: hypothetical protein IJU37_07860, partial [Desulfovibrio sp.]|nr:hypothetical protein [Desulfovibrio sp.]